MPRARVARSASLTSESRHTDDAARSKVDALLFLVEAAVHKGTKPLDFKTSEQLRRAAKRVHDKDARNIEHVVDPIVALVKELPAARSSDAAAGLGHRIRREQSEEAQRNAVVEYMKGKLN